MGMVAKKLATADIGPGSQKGPTGACYSRYKDCDAEDLAQVRALKEEGHTWQQIQEHVDSALGIDNPVGWRIFAYHWRGQCKCWTGKL